MATCISCGNTHLKFISEYLYYGEKFREFFPDLNFLSCDQCGLQQIDHENVDEQRLADYYRYYYRKEIDFIAKTKVRHMIWIERGRTLANLAAQYIESAKVDKIFEVGSGYGYNLIEFQKQFKQARLFTDELANELPPPQIMRANIDDGPYDIIIMSHVLEHLRYPKEFLSRVVKNLQPNGLLVIEVPNEQIGQFVYQEKNGIPFHTPHLTFFTSKALYSFFSENFQALHIKHVGTAGPTLVEVVKRRERKINMLKRTPHRLLSVFPPLLRKVERLCELAIEHEIARTLNYSNDTETFDKVFLRIVLIRK